MTQRLFVAVSPDAPTRDALDQALGAARGASANELRWIPKESWHFTLQFLGATGDEVVAPVVEACRRAAARHAPFDIVLGGVGAFPSATRARVVWVGVTHGQADLAALASDVVAESVPLGFEPEQRPFQAHLTVARKKPLGSVAEVLAAMHTPASLRFEAREVVLYRSHLAQSGARYEALGRFPLGSSAG